MGIRRSEQALQNEEALQILDDGLYGVLAVSEGESAYAVPLSYVHQGGNLYLHGANEGRKINAITRHPKVCFTVVGQAVPLPEDFAMLYKSVVVFGTASVITDSRERADAMRLICKKYSPGLEERAELSLRESPPSLAVFKIAIEIITGKGSK